MQQLGSKGTVYIAVGVIMLGFLMIFIGWNGAAEKDFVSGQVPYVISGGFGGLGLVMVGATIALAEARRRDDAKVAAKLDRLLDHLGAAGEGEAEASKQVAQVEARRASRRRTA